MKKIYLISVLTVLCGLLFLLVPDWFKFLWGWQLLLLPFLAGILMVLVQNEDKSYNFLPKLIIGSFLTSFVFVALWQLIEYDYDGYFIFTNGSIFLNRMYFWRIGGNCYQGYYFINRKIC
jgi:hypothetical protein